MTDNHLTLDEAAELVAWARKQPADPQQAAPRALTREAIAAMSVDEINARWPEVRAVIAGQRPPGPLSPAELADLEHLDRDAINAHWGDQVKPELERRASAARREGTR